MDAPRILAGRYALISHLARGGMADVWVAHDRLLDRRVAVKILHPEYAASESFVERFRREAQAAANLNHANVVDVYDWGLDQGIYFMVMELIQGQDLRAVLRADGALDPHRVAEIAAAVAAALGAAHDRGLVHRDIKPANVLLTADGEVKVTDFGIARAWDDSDQLTRTGAVIGTATYFSPEQAQGLTADGRSDLYSLGVVMYELLTGVPPFVGESPVSVAYQHVREFAPPPSDMDPNIPAALDAIVMRCLEKDPRQRYQNAGALVTDLHRFLSGQMPSPPPTEAATRIMTAAGGPPLPRTATTGVSAEAAYHDPGHPDRSTLVIGILSAVALLGLGLVLLFRLLLPGAGPSTVTVPDVRGQTREAAVAALAEAGLQVEEDLQVPDAELPAGLVAGTDPSAGQEVESGSAVHLLISRGAGDTTVPPLVGETESRARDLLSQAGLIAAVTYEPSEVIPQGSVMAQDRQAGAVVAAGTVVNLVVSAGTNALTVPDVVNHPERDAMLKLAEAGFALEQVSVERKPSADVIVGYVIETDPIAGTTLPVDGVVTIVISQGPVPTVVPSVVGQTPEAARSTLEELSFVVVFDDPVELAFGDPNNGKIAEQDPAAGQRVDFGSTVKLKVGEAAATIVVPNVLGQTPAAAQAAVQALTLVYAEGAPLLLNAGDPYLGKVADVSPAVGTPLSAGATVTVRLGAEGARVPDVAGAATCMSPSAAKSAIEAAGLVYQVAEIVDDAPVGDPCANKAVGQSPAPFNVTNTLVARGTVVAVSLDGVTVPDVRAWTLKGTADPPPPPTDYDLAKSQQILREQLGFNVVVQECRLQEPAYTTYAAFLGMVVDLDALGSPPGTAVLLYGAQVIIYTGVSTTPPTTPYCTHTPPP